MTLVNLNQLLTDNRAIAGLVCLGWEEVRAYVEAAEAENVGAALMVGPGARGNMPLPIWGKMLRTLAENADTPIALHLDHGRSIDEVQMALDEGFTSVMYDGSQLPLAENIKTTRAMVELSRKYGASSEGEIGYVGYANGAQSSGTDPIEAAQFSKETDVDFMAISAGNVHLQEAANTEPDWARLEELAKIGTPLVIHGGSGFSHEVRAKMTRDYFIRKFNIGTELRQVFGIALRKALNDYPDVYDHITILNKVHDPLVEIARKVISGLDLKR